MKKKPFLTTAILALLGGGIYAGSGMALKPLATQFIRQNGFPTASIGNISLTPTGAMVESIALDGNEFSTVDNIDIGFKWLDFLKNRSIESLSIKNISLTCELDENGQFKIAGWDAKLPESTSTSAFIPVKSLLLQGVTVDCETPVGNIRAEGKLSLTTNKENTQNIIYTLWGQQRTLSFDADGKGTILSNGTADFTTTFHDARVNFSNISFSRGAGIINHRISTQNSKTSGKFAVGKATIGKDITIQNTTIFLDSSQNETLLFKFNPAGNNGKELVGKWFKNVPDKIKLTLNSPKQKSYELNVNDNFFSQLSKLLEN